jgi:hypothetical protein
MIQQLLESDLEVVIQSGFIHVPLLFDPSVDCEIHTPPRPDTLIQVNGRQFVRAVNLQSLLENYPAIYPGSYEELRYKCLPAFSGISCPSQLPLDETLQTILFQVMPHFIRRRESLERKELSEEGMLGLIERKLPIPARCYEEAKAFRDRKSLQGLPRAPEEQRGTVEPLRDGLISAHNLGEWIYKAMAQRIVDEERVRARGVLEGRGRCVGAEPGHLALLLYLAESGAVEIDGFGFSRTGSGEGYVVYKRTGEYALNDYYGRLYLFPDCRVAISTLTGLRPFVVEHYKHPFLEGHDSGQYICMRNFNPPNVFTAAGAIRALEEGIGALLYGYSGRRRNGYHSLDHVTRRPWGDEPDVSMGVGHPDYPLMRRSHLLDVDFDEYRIASDHPNIISGQVSITNQDTP